jgi:hypothetical protein
LIEFDQQVGLHPLVDAVYAPDQYTDGFLVPYFSIHRFVNKTVLSFLTPNFTQHHSISLQRLPLFANLPVEVRNKKRIA